MDVSRKTASGMRAKSLRQAATKADDPVLKITCGAKKSIAFRVELNSWGLGCSDPVSILYPVKICHSAQNLETEAKLAIIPPTWKKALVRLFDKPVVRIT